MAKVTLNQADANDFPSFAARFGMKVHELFNHGSNSKVMHDEAVARGFDSPHYVAPVLDEQTHRIDSVPGIHAFAGAIVDIPNDKVPAELVDHPSVVMTPEEDKAFNPQQGNNLTAENAALKAQLAEMQAWKDSLASKPAPSLTVEAAESNAKPPKADTPKADTPMDSPS